MLKSNLERAWLVLLGGLSPFLLPCRAQEGFSLTILHVNDHHSHLEEESFSLDTADLPFNLSSTDEVTVTYGGYPRIVSLVNSLQAASTTDGLLKLHAGDALTGTLYYSFYRGEADAAMMNFVCFDALTLGNHEFDDGDESLAEFARVVSFLHHFLLERSQTLFDVRAFVDDSTDSSSHYQTRALDSSKTFRAPIVRNRRPSCPPMCNLAIHRP